MPGGTSRPSSSTTRSSMPGSGRPSVPNTFSSGSARPLLVTSPFSVMPQPAEMAQRSRSRASLTSWRGMEAPAQMKTRNEERSRVVGV